jgi:hypothetical protein
MKHHGLQQKDKRDVATHHIPTKIASFDFLANTLPVPPPTHEPSSPVQSLPVFYLLHPL